MFLSKKNVDATKGDLLPLIFAYTIPLIISTLIQSFFHAVDIAVLGNMADNNAVASVGATSAITSLVVHTFVGLSAGTKIILARFIGMRDVVWTRKTVNTSLLTALWTGVIVAGVGYFFAPYFLQVTNCPAECFDGALVYIRIYLLGAPAILLYNYGSAILTAAGDTQRPLYYIIAGGLLNVVLNIILCLILPEKVMAVAIATIASQALGAILVIRRLCIMEGVCHLELRQMSFSLSALGKILRYGAPVALTHMLYPLSNLQIQSAINSFGPAAIAGSSAEGTLESIPSAFGSSFSSTTAVFMGQNIGADKPERVRKSFWLCTLIGTGISLVIGLFIYFTGEFWLSLLVDGDAISYGMIRMFYLMLFYFIAIAKGCVSHAIQVYGYPLADTIVSVAGVLLFRAVWMELVYPHYETFDNLMFCFLISWTVTLLVNMIILTFVSSRYKRGIYKRI